MRSPIASNLTEIVYCRRRRSVDVEKTVLTSALHEFKCRAGPWPKDLQRDGSSAHILHTKIKPFLDKCIQYILYMCLYVDVYVCEYIFYIVCKHACISYVSVYGNV